MVQGVTQVAHGPEGIGQMAHGMGAGQVVRDPKWVMVGVGSVVHGPRWTESHTNENITFPCTTYVVV